MKKLLFTISAVSLFCLHSQGATPTWPSFRGPNGSGVSTDANPPVTFGPGTNELWHVDVPSSPSSPVVWGNRIFLTTFHEGKLETRCYDRKNGKLLWARICPADKLEDFLPGEGSPAASSPVTDGKRVVSYFGSCGLVCYDLDGTEQWRLPLPTVQTGGGFGSGSSPIIVGQSVIVNRDQIAESSLLAVNLRNGKKLWEAARPDSPTSYGTPIVAKLGKSPEIIHSGSLTMRSYNPKTGSLNWTVRRLAAFSCTTPVVGDGMLFTAAWSPGKSDSPWPKWESFIKGSDKNGDGYLVPEEMDEANRSFFKAQDLDKDGKLTKTDWDAIESQMSKGENRLVAVKPNGTGDITETHVAWSFERGLPYVPSPLYYEGRVYLVKDGGMMTSLDAKTGKVFYQQERLGAAGNYYTSPVAASGRIYVSSLNKGAVTVVKAGGTTPEILHRVEFGERIAATPALVENKLYLRTDKKLYAFGPAGK